MKKVNKFVLAEQQIQSNFWFMYKAANIGAFLFMCILSHNKHDMVALAMLIAQIAANVYFIPKRIDEFAERIKHVAFKTELFNIYVTTLSPDQTDDQVTATFQTTLQYLKQVGNTHGIRVHLFMYRDVNIFTKWFDASGNLQTKVTPRPDGCSYQSFENYLIDVHNFRMTDTESRLRELRKDNVSFDWVNENVFEQTPSSK